MVVLARHPDKRVPGAKNAAFLAQHGFCHMNEDVSPLARNVSPAAGDASTGAGGEGQPLPKRGCWFLLDSGWLVSAADGRNRGKPTKQYWSSRTKDTPLEVAILPDDFARQNHPRMMTSLSYCSVRDESKSFRLISYRGWDPSSVAFTQNNQLWFESVMHRGRKPRKPAELWQYPWYLYRRADFETEKTTPCEEGSSLRQTSGRRKA
jgi:hypothetical protein